MVSYTKEQKKEYFANLRESWNNCKQLSEIKGKEIDAIINNHGLSISRTGFMFVSMQLEQQGLDGLPYLDAKTFKGWRENGFKVVKGQKSTLSGITWINCEKKNSDEKDDIAAQVPPAQPAGGVATRPASAPADRP